MTGVVLIAGALLALVSAAEGGRIFVVAPSVFRFNVEEKIFVVSRQEIKDAEIYLTHASNAARKISLVKTSFLPSVPKLLRLKISPEEIPKSWDGSKIYFKLNVKFTGFQKSSEVLLDFKTSDVLLQTDKPIYTPNQAGGCVEGPFPNNYYVPVTSMAMRHECSLNLYSNIRYRVIPVGRDLKPINGKITVDIKNPAGDRVRRAVFQDIAQQGFGTGDIKLTEYPMKGTWTITAVYGHQEMLNSSVSFVVKEYVLPKFSVEVISAPYVSEKNKTITFSVLARYVYGKPVKGSVSLRLAVATKDKIIPFFSLNSQINGREDFKDIYTDQVTQPKEIPSFPYGARLLIEANVTERVSGDKESVRDSSIVFVESPFKIHLKRGVLFYKPGLPYELRFDVLFPNGQPASNLPLKIDALVGGNTLTEDKLDNNRVQTDELGQVNYKINTPLNPKGDKVMIIKITTLHIEQTNTVFQVMVQSYASASGNFILVRGARSAVQIGTYANFEALVPAAVRGVDRLYYMFISRGVIVESGVIAKNVDISTTIRIRITGAMAPDCRFLAYYIVGNEVVTDSTVFQVEQEFDNQVRVAANKKSYIPAEDVYLTVQSDKDSRIGLLGVDESIYLLRNKDRLLREKIFKNLDLYDLGCGQGGGLNSQDVFERSGLSVITDEALTTRKRESIKCPKEKTLSRRRRAIQAEDITEEVITSCCQESKCCNKLKEMKREKTCQKAMNLMPQDKACRSIFMKCCKTKTARGRSLAIVESEIDNLDLNPNDINDDDVYNLPVRRYFPDAWIWENHEIGDKNEWKSGYTMPDSLTTWIVSALSINNQTGFGLSPPLSLHCTMQFFVRLKMPYSAQRMEQITVYAIVHNYYRNKILVNIYFKGHHSFCSSAKPGKRSRRISVHVDGNDAVSVPYTIVPMQIGRSPIEIQAFSSDGQDAVEKQLLVLPEGETKTVTEAVTLDPQGIMEDKKGQKQGKRDPKAREQLDEFEVSVPKNFIKGSHKAMIYVTGNVMGPVATALIEGGLEKLIALPTGCGEQIMIKMAPLVYTLRYLEKAKGSLTEKIEKNAYTFMRQGYTQVLKYKREDGAFSAWGSKLTGSTWLTAFVVKVLCQARHFIKEDIDEGILCEAMQNLDAGQESDGSFPEKLAVIHKEMIGGVKGGVAMTAFVLIALLECQKTCEAMKERSVPAAVAYLESQLDDIDTPYVLSLVTYALTLANSRRKNDANSKLKTFMKVEVNKGKQIYYWQQGEQAVTALNIEATSYALLTQLEIGDLDICGPIVNWLTQQRNARGSFFSTQDTVVALQALSSYSIKTAGGQMDLTVNVRSEVSKNIAVNFKIDSENALLRQQKEITEAIGGKLFIDTTGIGTAQLQVVTEYNVPLSKRDKCGYEFEVDIVEAGDNESQINDPIIQKIKKLKCKELRGKKKKKCRAQKKKLRKQQREQQSDAKEIKEVVVQVCARDNRGDSSGMAIIDIGILTGFEPDIALVEQLMNTPGDLVVNNYETNDRHLILHVAKIPQIKRVCLNVTTRRKFPVGETQPVPVKVYDYYEPEHSCTSYYGPKKGSGLLQTICQGDECECGQAGCASCDTDISLSDLKKRACLNANFVLRAEVLSKETDHSMTRIIVQVEQIFKLGRANYQIGSKLELYQAKTCQCPKLKIKERYLFMLNDGVIYRVDNTSTVRKWPNGIKSAGKLQTAMEEVRDGFVCDEFYQ